MKWNNGSVRNSKNWMIEKLPFLFLILMIEMTVVQAQPQSDVIHIGDLIQVNLPGETSLNRTFQVDKRGRISLPEIGPVYVAGYNETQLTQTMMSALSKVFRDVSNASVFVAKQQIIVSVQGYVKSPGEYTLPHSADIQTAIHAAGGARSGAQLDKMQLKRGKNTSVFNYKSFLNSGDESVLPSLMSMDILFVPASPIVGNIEQEFDPAKLANSGDSADSKMAIKVFGEVNAPGSFSYQKQADLVDILMRAGGVTRYASVEQIRVISNNEPKLFNLKSYLDSGDSAMLPQIVPGTTIFVPKQEEEIKAGANMVYIMGEVARPGAFEGKSGATFMDILANAGGPTRFAEARQIRIIKADSQVIRFDLTAYTEGLSQQPLPTIHSGDAIFVPEKVDMNEKSWLKVTPDRAVNVIGEVVRPGRIEWSDEMNLMDLLAHVGGPTLRADTTRIEIATKNQPLQTFDLDSFITAGAPVNKLPQIQAGSIIRIHDLPQDPSDNKSQWVRQSSDASIYVFGQVNAPGRYLLAGHQTLLVDFNLFNPAFKAVEMMKSTGGIDHIDSLEMTSGQTHDYWVEHRETSRLFTGLTIPQEQSRQLTYKDPNTLTHLVNVLRGEMSLIGPRPERPSFYQNLENKIPYFTERTYGILPGITGLAQVNQGYDTCIDDVRRKVAFDHSYSLSMYSLHTWLIMDIKIIYKTLFVMIYGKGQ